MHFIIEVSDSDTIVATVVATTIVGRRHRDSRFSRNSPDKRHFIYLFNLFWRIFFSAPAYSFLLFRCAPKLRLTRLSSVISTFFKSIPLAKWVKENRIESREIVRWKGSAGEGWGGGLYGRSHFLKHQSDTWKLTRRSIENCEWHTCDK